MNLLVSLFFLFLKLIRVANIPVLSGHVVGRQVPVLITPIPYLQCSLRLSKSRVTRRAVITAAQIVAITTNTLIARTLSPMGSDLSAGKTQIPSVQCSVLYMVYKNYILNKHYARFNGREIHDVSSKSGLSF